MVDKDNQNQIDRDNLFRLRTLNSHNYHIYCPNYVNRYTKSNIWWEEAKEISTSQFIVLWGSINGFNYKLAWFNNWKSECKFDLITSFSFRFWIRYITSWFYVTWISESSDVIISVIQIVLNYVGLDIKISKDHRCADLNWDEATWLRRWKKYKEIAHKWNLWVLESNKLHISQS